MLGMAHRLVEGVGAGVSQGAVARKAPDLSKPAHALRKPTLQAGTRLYAYLPDLCQPLEEEDVPLDDEPASPLLGLPIAGGGLKGLQASLDTLQQQSAAAPAQQQAATAAPMKTEGEIAAELADHKQAEEAVKAAADAVKAAADLTKGAGASPSPEPASKCKAILDTATDEWCATTCATSYCPPTACKCDDA